MKGNSEKVLECTAGTFDGTAAILDPDQSWVVSNPSKPSSIFLNWSRWDLFFEMIRQNGKELIDMNLVFMLLGLQDLYLNISWTI